MAKHPYHSHVLFLLPVFWKTCNKSWPVVFAYQEHTTTSTTTTTTRICLSIQESWSMFICFSWQKLEYKFPQLPSRFWRSPSFLGGSNFWWSEGCMCTFKCWRRRLIPSEWFEFATHDSEYTGLREAWKHQKRIGRCLIRNRRWSSKNLKSLLLFHRSMQVHIYWLGRVYVATFSWAKLWIQKPSWCHSDLSRNWSREYE